MADVTVVFWRDIPAQVIVGKGRRGSKVQLTERFEQAIDRCAMKVGARDTDSYLAEWRKAPAYEVEGDQDSVARAEADRLEAEYDTARLKALIDAETAKNILSDQQLAEMLQKEGFDLARRTVAKYREAIGIGSSAERRRAKKLAGAR